MQSRGQFASQIVVAPRRSEYRKRAIEMDTEKKRKEKEMINVVTL